MPLISVRAPSFRDASTARADQSKEEGIDVIIVPAIGAKPDVVLHRLQSSQSYFQQNFYGILKDATVLLFDFPEESAQISSDTSVIDRYANSLLENVVSHRITSKERLPLHFVGHSTGGLVIKKALLLAEHSAAHWSISSSCRSIAFFGVPHQGSSIMSEAPFAQSVQRALGLKQEMSEPLRSSLQPGSEELIILATDFASLARRMKRIWTFVENEDSTLKILASSYDAGDAEIVVHLPIVDKRSATLQIGNETLVDLGTTHAELLSPSILQAPASMRSYLKGLKALLDAGLKKEEDLDDEIRKSVVTELHLFYNGSKEKNKPSIKLWSTYAKLENLLRFGPSKSFEERLFHAAHKSEDPHLMIPNATTKIDFSKHHVSDGRQASVEDVSELDSRLNGYAVADSTPRASAPAITITRTNTMPSVPSIKVSPANPTDQTQRSIELSVKTVTNSENLQPVSQNSNVDAMRAAKDLEQLIRSRTSTTFQLPDPSRRRFRWVHVPCNNMIWIPEIMKCLTQENQHVRQHLQETLLHEDNLFAKQSVGRHGKPHSRHMKPGCRYFDQARARGSGSSDISSHDCQLSIFLPYLHWDSFKSLKVRNRLVDEIWSGKVEESTKRRVRNGHSLEHKLICQYLVDSANAPLHHRRTLDQYGYPDLRSTQARDEDQVLYKRRSRTTNQEDMSTQQPESKKRKGNERHDLDLSILLNPEPKDDEGGKVLMVDQLWCWVVDQNTVLTCFSPKEEEDEREKYSKPGDLRNAIYNDVNGDPRFASQCHNVFDFAALVVEHATKVFIDDFQDEDLQVFRIFEEYIGILIEQHTESFKAFRDRYREKGAYGGLRRSVLHSDDALARIQEVDLRANERDLTALLELRDIEDELNTVDKLFRDQIHVLDELKKHYLEWESSNAKGLSLLHSSTSRIEEYRAQVKDMQTNCKSAQQAFMRLLDMKQKQANLAEAWAARESSAVATSQNRAVMVFTIFTIIFLPLGFFTSLFGMNTVDWSGNHSMPRLHLIFLWTFPVSSLVIVAALLVAYNRYVQAKTVALCRRICVPLARRKKRDDDFEQLVGMLKERDTSAGLRLLHPTAVLMAGYGQIPIDFRE